MRKIFLKLTKEQKAKGIIYTSSLSETRQEGEIIHEVLETQNDKYEVIARLKDDKFFNNSHYNYNIVRK